MCTKLGSSTEKKTPNEVLFIRTAGSMIAVVVRQVIDMTVREGHQDWSWMPSLHDFCFSPTSVQALFRSVRHRRSQLFQTCWRCQPPRFLSQETGSVFDKFLRSWMGSNVRFVTGKFMLLFCGGGICYEVGKQSHRKRRFDRRHRRLHSRQLQVALGH